MSMLSAPGVSAAQRLHFEDLPDGLLVVDESGYVQDTNDAFLLLVERSRQDVIGYPLSELVAPEDMLCLVGFEAMFGPDSIYDGHMIFSGPGDSRRPLVISAGFSRDRRHVIITARQAGRIHRELADASRWVAQEQERAHLLTEARDALSAKNTALLTAQAALEQAYSQLKDEIGIRERLERELGAARKLEALGQLSAGVAHEINTPLQYVGDSVHFLGQAFSRISGYLERIAGLLEQRPAPTWSEAEVAISDARKQARLAFLINEVPQALGACKDGIGQVSNIVQALKAFSHQDQDEKSPDDLNAALRSALVMARHEYKNLAVVREELGPLPLVPCLITQLNQVFLNLIVNAAHAIADASRSELGTITIRSCVLDGAAEISIADDGCGIPASIQHKIFEPFFTTKEVGRGTGQGLALARQMVVDRHGGSIEFESEVGKGTVFKIRIPILE